MRSKEQSDVVSQKVEEVGEAVQFYDLCELCRASSTEQLSRGAVVALFGRRLFGERPGRIAHAD